MHKMNTRPCPEAANPSALEDIKKHISCNNPTDKIADHGREDSNRSRNLGTEADIHRTSNVSVVYVDSNQNEKHLLVKYDHIKKINSTKESDSVKQAVIPNTDDTTANPDEVDKKQHQEPEACPECGYYFEPKPEMCKECGQVKVKVKERCKGCGQVVPVTCQDCGQRIRPALSFGEMAAYSQYRFELERSRRLGYYDDWSSSESSSCHASTSRKLGYNEEYDSMYSDDFCGCADCQKERKKYQRPCIIADSKTTLCRSKWKMRFQNIFFRNSSKCPKTTENIKEVEGQRKKEDVDTSGPTEVKAAT